MSAPTSGPLRPSRRILALAPAAVGACALALTGWLGFERASATGTPSTIVDFDVFHLVGRLVLESRLTEAYATATLQKLEAQLSSDAMRSIPFAYPPPFALAMAGLASVPTSLAYALFEGFGLATLVAALWRLSPLRFWPVMLAMMPAIFINVIIGQNGMLTAGLAGIAAGLAVDRRGGAAGAVAGLLAALKPQLSLALPMMFVGRRDWRSIVAMAASGSALVGLSCAVLGPAILPAFLGALSETSAFLAQGRFPLHRMTSVYAFFRSLGAPAGLSMTLHVVAALAILGTVARRASREDARVGSGLTLIGACFVSPYFYDYDLPVAGLGLAMLLPALAGAGRGWRIAVPLCCLALAESSGLVETLLLPLRVSLGAPLLLACLTAALLSSSKGIARPAAEARGPAAQAAA